MGPHGFHSLGRSVISSICPLQEGLVTYIKYRVVESTLRTANNLLERLHASFFFYIMTGPTTFLKIGSFLPSAVIISVAMMFAGLYEWVNAGWALDGASSEKDDKEGTTKPKWIRRPRPVLHALCIVIATHVLGVALFCVMSTVVKHRTVRNFHACIFAQSDIDHVVILDNGPILLYAHFQHPNSNALIDISPNIHRCPALYPRESP